MEIIMGVGIKGFGGSGGGSTKLQGFSALPPAAVVAKNIFATSGPPSLTGVAAHYDAQDFASLGLTSLNVDSWSDLSGNSRSLSQTGATRPTYDATGANGSPSIRFADLTNQFFDLSPPTVTNTDKTVMVVMEASSVGVAAKILINPYTFLGGTLRPTLTHVYWPGANGFGISTFASDVYGASNTVVTEDELFISTVYFDSENMTSGLRMFINEIELTGLSQTQTFTNNLTDIGTSFLMGNSQFPWAGVIGELYMIDGLMDNTERDDLITFLKTKWSIS